MLLVSALVLRSGFFWYEYSVCAMYACRGGIFVLFWYDEAIYYFVRKKGVLECVRMVSALFVIQ